MKIVPLGVRGSIAAPGAAFVRYGGHTSCLAVFAAGQDVPRLILDAGTGLTGLPQLLNGAAYDGQIVLTHLHWDHVQGLPFCPPVDRPEARVTLHIPVEEADGDPVELLARSFSPPHFPIGPDGLLGTWRFVPLRPGRVDDVVTVAPIAHKGGLTFGIRVELDGSTLAYLPDHALNETITPSELASAHALVDGVDVLVHDGQYLPSERAIAVAYAHATIDRVLEFADACAVGAVVLTHHSPGRTDDALDELAATVTRTPGGRPVTFAVQGVGLGVPLRR
ncbi:MAG TPA: MBL fold metallo-hydrolase [Jatrophihabitantaceae bacterium]|nr:MBL fold metallo-hydrolase [Jatrophihabitantaceae bacterium]